MVQLPDIELIELVRNGSDGAFEHLLSRYHPLIKRLTNSYFVRNYDADDLYQIGILAFYHAALTYNVTHGASFYAFALSCVRNKVISIWRKNREDIEFVTDHQDFLLVMENHADSSVSSEIFELLHGNSSGRRQRFEKLLTNRDIFSHLEYDVLKNFIAGMDSYEIACAKGLQQKQIDDALGRVKIKMKQQGLR